MTPNPRRGSARTLLLVAGVLAVLGLAGYKASRHPWVRSWTTGHDADNPAELAALETAPLAVAPAGSEWFQWRGPDRDGRAPDGPFRTDWDKTPPKTLWSAPCGGGFSSFAVAGGRVYTQDRQDDTERVICLNADTGEPVWQYAAGADFGKVSGGYATGPRATPTVAGNRVYAVGTVGRFVCLEAPASAGGQPRVVWEHDLVTAFDADVPQWGFASSPLLEGDLVIVQPGGRGGSVAAFDRSTGALRWKAGSNPNGYSSPVAATVGGVRVVFALTGDALLCVRAADGKVTGKYKWDTSFNGNIATPIVVGDYVFLSSGYNKGCALLRAVAGADAVGLEEVYARNNRVMRTHHSTCVYRDGFLYGFDDSRLKCVDFRKGREVEDWEADGVAKGTLILAGNHLIVLTETGDLVLAEATPEEYRQVVKLPKTLTGSQTWTLPVLAGGRLYLRDDEKVLCLDVRP
jgi:outer membrane protein assembly factor BamB